MKKDLGKTSIGVEPNIGALFCYIGGFITGIIFFLIEKKNKFVRFHAMQSILVFGGIFVLRIAFAFLQFMLILLPLLSLLSLILWILLMVKAYQGEMFKLPIVGDIAEKQAAAGASESGEKNFGE